VDDESSCLGCLGCVGLILLIAFAGPIFAFLAMILPFVLGIAAVGFLFWIENETKGSGFTIGGVVFLIGGSIYFATTGGDDTWSSMGAWLLLMTDGLAHDFLAMILPRVSLETRAVLGMVFSGLILGTAIGGAVGLSQLSRPGKALLLVIALPALGFTTLSIGPSMESFTPQVDAWFVLNDPERPLTEVWEQGLRTPEDIPVPEPSKDGLEGSHVTEQTELREVMVQPERSTQKGTTRKAPNMQASTKSSSKHEPKPAPEPAGPHSTAVVGASLGGAWAGTMAGERVTLVLKDNDGALVGALEVWGDERITCKVGGRSTGTKEMALAVRKCSKAAFNGTLQAVLDKTEGANTVRGSLKRESGASLDFQLSR
jgi:hypothetical protein